MDHYKDTADLYNRVAKAYESKFMDMDLYDHTYDAFCDQLTATNSRIFEIGCGPGNITKYLLQKRPDSKLDAIDVAPNMIALAKKNNPNANFWVMDCREISTLQTRYDGIICGFCVPYLSNEDCDKLLADCNNLLNPNGILYLSFVEGDYFKSGYQYDSPRINKYHLFYHQQAQFINLLPTHHFKILETFKIPYPAENPSQTHIVILARKQQKRAVN